MNYVSYENNYSHLIKHFESSLYAIWVLGDVRWLFRMNNPNKNYLKFITDKSLKCHTLKLKKEIFLYKIRLNFSQEKITS